MSVDESRPTTPASPIDASTDASTAASGSPSTSSRRPAGCPARTIRFYRQTGLIDSPRRIGRQAFYSEDQVARLRLIAALRARGLGLDAVSKILADPTGEHRVVQPLLQIRDELLEPWIDDHSAIMTEAEVLALLGTSQPAVIDELVALRRARPASTTSTHQIEVPSVTTLDLTGQLMAAGASPEVAQSAWVAHAVPASPTWPTSWSPSSPTTSTTASPRPPPTRTIAAAVGQLRPIAMRAVQVAFAHEIERAIEELYVGRGPDPAALDHRPRRTPPHP